MNMTVQIQKKKKSQKFRLVLVCFLIITGLCGCRNIKYHELYSITDSFVEKLNTTYQSYGITGGIDDTKYTKDKQYKVFPIGRLINVRIEHYATDKEYESLRKALESHYSRDKRVNKVYINQAGTLMIDCRN